QFNAEITAGEGIEISLDDKTYYTTIPASVIQAKITDELKVSLKDVTSNDGKSFKYFRAESPIVYNNETKKPYIEFDLYVRSPEANAAIALNNYTFSSTDGETSGTKWTADANFISSFGGNVTAGTEGTYYAHAALRMSLTPVTEESEGEPQEGVAQVYQAPAEGNVNKVIDQNPIEQGMVSYYKAKNGENSINISNVTIANALVEPSENPILTLETANTAQRIKVRIWIEGWDPDCFNAILNSKINVSFGLIKVVNQG
ncbi:MAG TPA: hypothetical protein PK840_06535, partial [Bacilli bacterium]|nr:hypothetical protein [Bacilli bacterium]